MCQRVYFMAEKIVAESMADLATILGGFDSLKLHRGYGSRKRTIGDGKSCLCPVDIAKTLAPTEYILSQWEDGFDYTARKPDWLIAQEKREQDRMRYEAAMAEMRADQPA